MNSNNHERDSSQIGWHVEEVEGVVVGIDVLPSFLLFWFSGLSVSTTMTNLLMTSYENDNYLQPF